MEKLTKSFNEGLSIYFKNVALQADLCVPANTTSLVMFIHGSGSSRFSPRNQYVAKFLQSHGHGTLLLDLLTPEEEKIDSITGEYRFDIELLAQRVIKATEWVKQQRVISDLHLGYFGASTGAAAAIIAAANMQNVDAIVSRGGRPDLAGEFLSFIKAPTLLIVGGADTPIIELNRKALATMNCEKELKIVPGAGHLFEEAGKLEEAAKLTNNWFEKYLLQNQSKG